MIQRDYVLRLIDQMIRAILAILGLRKAGQFEEAQIRIGDTFKKLLGLDADLVESLAVVDLKRLLSTSGEPDPGKCSVAARLLEEQALVYEAKGQTPAAQEIRRKALELYGYAATLPGAAHCREFLDRQDDLRRLLEKKDDLPGS